MGMLLLWLSRGGPISVAIFVNGRGRRGHYCKLSNKFLLPLFKLKFPEIVTK